jgi:hypothetical protein
MINMAENNIKTELTSLLPDLVLTTFSFLKGDVADEAFVVSVKRRLRSKTALEPCSGTLAKALAGAGIFEFSEV